jgi:hypothetical protein
VDNLSPLAAIPPAPTRARQYSKGELCSTAASVATKNNLPILFFTNLIQQESGFQPHAVSPAGAQGIAQFMPRVAAAHGLINPFDPIHALTVSGKFLAGLVKQFGNLGLAAAAYNAGSKRVQDWRSRRRTLPPETRHYVQRITGLPADTWVQPALNMEVRLPPHTRCPDARTMEAQAAERAKPTIKVAGRAGSRERATVVGAKDTMPLVSAQQSKKAPIVVATRSSRKSLVMAPGPAAKRFAAMATPSIMAPEKASSHPEPTARAKGGDRIPKSAKTAASRPARVAAAR